MGGYDLTEVVLFTVGVLTAFVLFFIIVAKGKNRKSSRKKKVEETQVKKSEPKSDDWGSFPPEDESFEG